MEKKIFSDKTYRPLPKGLTIESSKVEGLGLHATEDLEAGIVLGKTHVMSSSSAVWVRTPLGGFINHSNTPNCFIITTDTERELYSVVPIKKGDEITVFYTHGYDDIIM